MDATPPLEAWVLLGILWVAVALGAAISNKASVRQSDGLSGQGRWLMAPAAIVALGLPVISVFDGGEWMAVLWWVVVALPLAVVTGVTAASAAIAIIHWRGSRSLASATRRAEVAITCLSIAAALLIPLVIGTLVSLGLAPTLATATALTVGYGIWHLAYAFARAEPRDSS